jgi:hypothetical protein
VNDIVDLESSVVLGGQLQCSGDAARLATPSAAHPNAVLVPDEV